MRKLVFFTLPAVAMFTLGGVSNVGLIVGFFAARALFISRPAAKRKFGVILGANASPTGLITFFCTRFSLKAAVAEGDCDWAAVARDHDDADGADFHRIWQVSSSESLIDVAWHAIEQSIGRTLMATLPLPPPRADRAS